MTVFTPNDQPAESRYRLVEQTTESSSLLEALFDENWRVRRLAAERLATFEQPERLVEPLLTVLSKRGHAGARNAAATALTQLGAKALPALHTLLLHPDPDQRKFAADILAALRHPASFNLLLAAVDDPDVNVRVAVAEAIGSLGGQDAKSVLERLLLDPEPLVQVCALEGLGALGAPCELPRLVPFLHNPLTHRSAWRLLGKIRHRSAWVLVAQALRATHRRDDALLAIGSGSRALDVDAELELSTALQAVDDAGPWLATCLASDDTERQLGALVLVRVGGLAELAVAVAEAAESGATAEAALEVLLSLKTPGLVALLEGTSAPLLSLSREARAVASEAVVENANPRFVRALARLREAGEPELEEVAVRALGRSHSVEAIGPLMAALEDETSAAVAARSLTHLAQTFPDEVKSALGRRVEGALQPHLVRAWANVAGTAAVPVLRRAMSDSSDAVRAAGAQMVVVAANEGASLLGLAVFDESPRVRRGAAKALSRMGADRSRPLLDRLLNDRDESVLSAACAAAIDCGAVWACDRLRQLASHADSAVVLAAMQACLALGVATEDALVAALRHSDVEVVKHVLLQGAASRVVVEAAVSLLSDARWDVRVAAARALEVSGARANRDAVRIAIERESDALALAALLTTERALGAR